MVPLASLSTEKDHAMNDEARLEARARRTASKAGLIARKSRRRDDLDHFGGFCLLDPHSNAVVAGGKFTLSAADVIRFCSD
jgi:hypothetical protein